MIWDRYTLTWIALCKRLFILSMVSGLLMFGQVFAENEWNVNKYETITIQTMALISCIYLDQTRNAGGTMSKEQDTEGGKR